MDVIAEGVETEQQLNKLGEFGVDFIQGYYFSKPLTAELCEKFLKKKLESPDIKSYQSKTKQA